METFPPSIGQCHIDIIVIDFGIKKCSDQLEMMDVPAIISGKGDVKPKSREYCNRGLSFAEVHSFVDIIC